MIKLLGSGVQLGLTAWSQIYSLFITTFNLKLNRDTALTIIGYSKIEATGLGQARTIVKQHLLNEL
jgi:hypothetical protein